MLEFFNEIIKNQFFSVATGLFGYLIGNHLALGRDKRKEFNNAASIFRNAFAEEIVLLKKEKGRRPNWGNSDDKWQTAHEIVGKAIKKHELAYINFRHYIGFLKKSGFDSEWKKYAEPNKEKAASNQFVEYDSLGDFQEEKLIRQRVIDRINNLMSYAKPK